MKKVLFLLCLLVLIIPLNVKAYYFSYPIEFIKVDDQGNYINDAEFYIHSINGNLTFDVVKTTEISDSSPTPISTRKLGNGDIINNGRYEFSSGGELNYNDFLSILGPEERQIVEDLSDYNNYQRYLDLLSQEYSSDYARLMVTRGADFYYSEECLFETPSPQSSDKDYNIKKMEGETLICPTIYLNIPVMMMLEETKAPVGYKKEKAIIEYLFKVTYTLDKNNNYALDGNPYVSYDATNLYKYNYEFDYSNIIDTYKNAMTGMNDDELFYKNECNMYYYGIPTGTLTSGVIGNNLKDYNVVRLEGDEPDCYNIPIIIDYKDGSKLTISSYVNNGGRTKAVKGSEVKYKVVVRNIGTSESNNNVITAKIPNGFEYVPGSASNNGEYIESTNSIRWNVDIINVESSVELTFNASVSEDVDLDASYISTATVTNDSNEEVESNETVVILQGEITNPKTGDFNKVLALFILSVVGFILYYVVDNKPIKSL